MTKKKLVTNKTRQMWYPIVCALIDGLLKEPPRTDGRGQRAKIRLKFRKDFKHVVKWPKFVWAPCDDPEYCVREWRNCTLLDHLYELTISPVNTNDVYKRRGTTLAAIDKMEKFVDNVGENV